MSASSAGSYAEEMTRGDPVPGVHEVLAYGDEDPPPRRTSTFLVAVAAGCLALGFAVGSGLGDLSPDRAETPPAAPVAAAGLTKLSVDVDDSRFWLRVFNWGTEPLEATVTALPGWARLEAATPTAIGPGSWGVLGFSAPATCDVAPGNVRTARLRLRTGSRVVESTVALSESARALREYQATVCAPPEPPSREQLRGVWLVEQGPGGLPVGSLLARFDSHGRFALDARGLLFSDPGMAGRYFLSGSRLRLVADGSRYCEAGDSFTWDVRLLPEGDLRIDHVSDNGGFCTTEPQKWVAHRLLVDSRAGP
jgi:hypothetical protein